MKPEFPGRVMRGGLERRFREIAADGISIV
jgi:hypothetical protein